MSYRQSRQNPPNAPTRQDEQIQTDVNLVSHSPRHSPNEIIQSSRFFEFCSEQNILRPFSDYYLLSQFNDLIDKLKAHTATLEQSNSKRLVHELAGQVHGLLTRQLRLSGDQSDYYRLLSQKEKEIIVLQIKNSQKSQNIEKAVGDYERKIQQLERQIENMRYSLDKYQQAEEQNQIYRNYFKEINTIVCDKKSVDDLQAFLTRQVIPKINDCEVDLAELQKKLAKDRTNKVKGAIARYARELEELSRSSSLNWELLNKSAAGFFTSIEHMKGDDWVRTRLNLSEKYEELANRHTATLSLVQKALAELTVSSPSLQSLGQFSRILKTQSAEYGFKTMNVNGWVGLGTVHCHRHHSHSEDLTQQIAQYKTILSGFQVHLKKIIAKYPQLRQELQGSLLSFIDSEIIGQIIDSQSLGRLLSVVVQKTQVITVDNVYKYDNKADKSLIFNLRVLIKALLDKLQEIRKQKGIAIDFDEGILAMLKENILDGVAIQDIIALYRPAARICEVDRVVSRPEFMYGQNQKFIPIRVQEGVPVNNKISSPIQVQHPKIIQEQINRYLHIEKPTQIVLRKQIPGLVSELVPTPVYQTITKEKEIEKIVEKNVYHKDTQKIIEIQREGQVVEKDIVKERQVPFEVIKKEIVEVPTKYPETIPEKIQYSKVIEVPTNIPVYVEKYIYEVVEKSIPQIIKRDNPVMVPYKQVVIEEVEVAVPVDRIVEKRVNVIDHCDCQKPEVINLTTQVSVQVQKIRDIKVEQCHFVKGDEIQKLVEVPIVKKEPVIHEIIKEVEFSVEKLFIQEIIDEKLMVVEKQIPIEFIKYEPVELKVEKAVILKDQVAKEVRVQVPVPIIIEKEVCKVVECRYETIVEKIVEVPRVEIVEKIVEKIVPVPRIIEKICTVPQIIEKCVVLNRPILQIVQVQKQVLVVEKCEVPVEVQVVKEVLRIEKELQTIEIQGEPITLERVIREPVEVQVIREKVVQKIVQVEKLIEVEVPVPLISKMVEISPVEVVREVPIYIEKQVPITTEVPVYYKQPEVMIQDCFLNVEKIVQLKRQKIKQVKVETKQIVYEEKDVMVPSQPIIQIEKELQLVYVDAPPVVQQIEVITTEPHYLYAEKVVAIHEQQYVQPQKVIEYLNQPKEITVQRMVPAEHIQQVPIEFPALRFSDLRTIVQTPEIQRLDKPVLKVVHEQTAPEVVTVEVQKAYDRVVEKIVEVEKPVIKQQSIQSVVYIEKERIVDGLKEIIYKAEVRPEYIEKIVERIVMLPQIVEVEKKVYMIEEINTLIAKQVNVQVHKEEYEAELAKLKLKADQLMQRLRQSRNKADTQMLAELESFYKILTSVNGMPKIVEVPKQVRVEVQKDRPVLVPVYDHEQEIALQLVINKLVQGISKFKKEDVERFFDAQILDIFFVEFGRVKAYETLQKCINRVVLGKQGERERPNNEMGDFIQGRWRSFTQKYEQSMPETQSLLHLSEAYNKFSQGYKSRRDDYSALKASMMKQQMEHYCKVEQSDKLNIFYIQIIKQLWDQIQDLKKKLANEQFNRDRVSNGYASIVRSIKAAAENKDKPFTSTHFETIIGNASSLIGAEQFNMSSRINESYIEVYESREVEGQGYEKMLGKEKRIGEMIKQISHYQSRAYEDQRAINEQRMQNQLLKQDLDRLQKASSSSEKNTYEMKSQMRVEWQNKMKDIENNYGNQINRLREQLNAARMSENNNNTELINENKRIHEEMGRVQRQYQVETQSLNNKVKALEAQKKLVTEEYERKMTQASSNQERQLRRQYETLKKNNEQTKTTLERQRQTMKNQYERKIQNMKDAHQREIDRLSARRDDNEQTRTTLERQKQTMKNQYERKIQNMKEAHQREIDRLSTRRDDNKDRTQEVLILKEQINELQSELEAYRKELEASRAEIEVSRRETQAIKKSHLGKTTYTSGIKQSAYQEGGFHSPSSGVERYRSPHTESQLSKQEHESQLSRESHGTRSLYRTKQREAEKRYGESEEIKSSSSRMSARSGGSGSSAVFKTSMTMREFMDIKKGDDKNNIMTIVMIKVIEKSLEECKKGFFNSYTPNNIFFSNFNANNLESMTVKFGAPITNPKSNVDGLYLAPEIHQERQADIKSVVFTLGVIWDEMIHYEIYFKSIPEIENLGHQFKVRDSKMNPILKNTLFEMMSKDPKKRLELGEAKRRISLQRYITSESKAGDSSGAKRL